MPTMGGKQEVSGDEFCYSIGIRDASGKGSNSKEEWAEGPDTLCIKYDWLTVKTVRFKPILIFEAQPNNTGNQRVLYVDGLVDNHSTDIKVIQN